MSVLTPNNKRISIAEYMYKKLFPLALVLLAIVLIFIFLKRGTFNQTSHSSQNDNEPKTSEVNQQVVKIVPQLIDIKINNEGKQVLSNDLETIRNSAIKIINSHYELVDENDGQYFLRGVGERYVVMTRVSYAGKNSYDIIIDMKEEKVIEDPRTNGYRFQTTGTIVYVGDESIAYYKLDASAVEDLPNSTLPKGRTYNRNYEGMPVTVVDETHDEKSFSISIFAIGDVMSGPDPKKVDEATFLIP